MTFDLFVHLIFRFIHITAVILFLGGVVYARQVLAPTLDSLPEAYRSAASSRAQTGYRTTLYTLLLLIVGSGLYNFLTFAGPKHSRDYQMWFGIKMLLVLHILATAILWATSSPSDAAASAKGKRRLISLAISGLIVVFISNYLRSLTLRGL